ncbi:MAG: substrate-binding domain-containing protein [Planctomycetes bacterium]|nr:substrate-binding domain-containing protein [Planctomycetota bacterium]
MSKQVKTRATERRPRLSPHRMQSMVRDLRVKFLRDLILSGAQPQDMLYSENELVVRYQTTLAAARRLYQELHEEGVVSRVRGQGTALMRLPHVTAHKPVVVFLSPSCMHDTSPWLTEYLGGLEGALADYGVHVRSYTPGDLGRGGLELLSEVDGVVVSPYAEDNSPPGFEAALQDLHRRQGNVIQVCGRLTGLPNITFDEFGAGAKAMQHLLEYGHKVVTFIGFDKSTWQTVQSERLRGAAQTAATAGPAVSLSSHCLELPLPGFPDEPADCPKLVEILQKELARQTTAVIAANDTVVSHIWREARGLGLHVPANLSIIGFDDHVNWRRYGITSTRYPWGELGERAARVLLTLDSSKQEGEIKVNTRLMLRSTTAPRSPDKLVDVKTETCVIRTSGPTDCGHIVLFLATPAHDKSRRTSALKQHLPGG